MQYFPVKGGIIFWAWTVSCGHMLPIQPYINHFLEILWQSVQILIETINIFQNPLKSSAQQCPGSKFKFQRFLGMRVELDPVQVVLLGQSRMDDHLSGSGQCLAVPATRLPMIVGERYLPP